jgi:hypothetical protein
VSLLFLALVAALTPLVSGVPDRGYACLQNIIRFM